MTDRAAFEQHFQLYSRQMQQHKDGSYRDSSVQDKWMGWQAKGEAKPLLANSAANPNWLFSQAEQQERQASEDYMRHFPPP